MNTKNVPRPKNPFNSDKLKERISRSIADRKKIVFYLLLCPCYPHDGSKFTYDSQSTGLSSDTPPNLDRFIAKLRNNIVYLMFHGVPEEIIQVRSLVCDIEYDLPTVLEKFAGGNKDTFLEIISQTAVNIGKVIQNQFLNHSKIDILSKTFLDGLVHLPKYQKQYTEYIQNNKLPDEFDRIRKKASDRTGMFEKLYGAITPEDKDRISSRQMINYFSVMRSIQEQVPGAIVINDKTPNVEFFNYPNICEILDTNEDTFPIFQVLS